jgi:hypothetical protein
MRDDALDVWLVQGIAATFRIDGAAVVETADGAEPYADLHAEAAELEEGFDSLPEAFNLAGGVRQCPGAASSEERGWLEDALEEILELDSLSRDRDAAELLGFIREEQAQADEVEMGDGGQHG